MCKRKMVSSMADDEIGMMERIYGEISALDVDARARILRYLTDRLRTPGGIAAEGGRARAEKLSPERRSDIARKAVTARWARRGQ